MFLVQSQQNHDPKRSFLYNESFVAHSFVMVKSEGERERESEEAEKRRDVRHKNADKCQTSKRNVSVREKDVTIIKRGKRK